jgi:hypothetical protein
MKFLFSIILVAIVSTLVLHCRTEDIQCSITHAKLIKIIEHEREDKPYYEMLWRVDRETYVVFTYDTVYSVGDDIPAIIRK